MCAYFTCLRRSNVLALTWHMIRPDVVRSRLVGGELRVPGTMTKNKRDLVLPLSGRLLDLFARRWRLRVAACPFVFHRAGKPVVHFDVPWRAAAAAIGHPGFLFHDLRRSGARALRRAGVDELTIMARGGWKTRSMFARYSITNDQDQREAQAKLDAAFATPGSRTVVPLDGRRRS
jgi:integrase